MKAQKYFHWEFYKNFLAYYFGGLYKRADEHHIFLMASGLAFSLFICMVPFIFIIFAILGMVLEKPTISTEINTFIERVIPYPNQADYIKEIVFSRVDEFKLYKNLAGWIGLIGLLFASSGLFSSMRTILGLAYKVKEKHIFFIGKIRDLGLVFIVLLYFLFSMTILPSFEIVKDFAHRVVIFEYFQFGYFEDVATGFASFLLILSVFLIIYSYIPMEKIPKKSIMVSSLSAAILWEIAKQLFGYYIAHVVTLNRIYGAYAFMIVVAFWVYYSSIVFIIGAEIGQLHRERKAKLNVTAS